jgi:hypothetical protein
MGHSFLCRHRDQFETCRWQDALKKSTHLGSEVFCLKYASVKSQPEFDLSNQSDEIVFLND